MIVSRQAVIIHWVITHGRGELLRSCLRTTTIFVLLLLLLLLSMVDLSDGDARGRRRRGRGRRTLLDFVRGVIVPSNFQRWNERFVID